MSGLGGGLFKTVEFKVGGVTYDYYGQCICLCGCKKMVSNNGTWPGGVPDLVKKCAECARLGYHVRLNDQNIVKNEVSAEVSSVKSPAPVNLNIRTKLTKSEQKRMSTESPEIYEPLPFWFNGYPPSDCKCSCRCSISTVKINGEPCKNCCNVCRRIGAMCAAA